MQAPFSKKGFIIVIALFSMSLLIGCAGMEKAGKERPGYLYYPSALVKADQVLDEARLAGKDKECPAEFNAAKNMVCKAYETYMQYCSLNDSNMIFNHNSYGTRVLSGTKGVSAHFPLHTTWIAARPT